jgi:hypothetical protein
MGTGGPAVRGGLEPETADFLLFAQDGTSLSPVSARGRRRTAMRRESTWSCRIHRAMCDWTCLSTRTARQPSICSTLTATLHGARPDSSAGTIIRAQRVLRAGPHAPSRRVATPQPRARRALLLAIGEARDLEGLVIGCCEMSTATSSPTRCRTMAA